MSQWREPQNSPIPIILIVALLIIVILDYRPLHAIRRDIKSELKALRWQISLECLPHWSFDGFYISVSPELEFKFKGFGKQLGLVLHVEIDYYSKKKDFTLEPLLDLNPLEIRWTQLIRHRF